MDLARIYGPVREDLDAVSRLLRDHLSADDAFIGQLVEHVLHTKGKLLRPALVCLSALACGGGSDERLAVAGAVELIHVASLVHDDVIDAADLRRGRASVNAVWGNQVAVLLGDYLFSKSFHMLALVKNLDLAAAMAGATVRMSQAEIKQIKYGNTPHTDEAIYFDIIEGKTAQLTSAACRCGALTARAPGPEMAALSEFGLQWGMAFQITDDALDLTATSEQVGKPIGSDIQTGKITLPIIYGLATASPAGRERLRELIDGHGGGHATVAGEVSAILAGCGAIGRALETARIHADRARTSLARIRRSPARDSLAALVEFAAVRTH